MSEQLQQAAQVAKERLREAMQGTLTFAAAMQAFNELKAALAAEQAQPVAWPKGWVFNHAQPVPDEDGVWEVGHVNEDGEFSPVITIDTGQYYAEQHAEPMARAIIAASAPPPAPVAQPDDEAPELTREMMRQMRPARDVLREHAAPVAQQGEAAGRCVAPPCKCERDSQRRVCAYWRVTAAQPAAQRHDVAHAEAVVARANAHPLTEMAMQCEQRAQQTAVPLTDEAIRHLVAERVEGVTVSEAVLFRTVAHAAIAEFCRINGIGKESGE